MNKKTDLRIKAKAIRKDLDIIEVSEKLTCLVRASTQYQQAQNVMLFYPTKFEVNLLGLLDDVGKNFYFPRVDGENMLVCPYQKGDKLEKSCFNILEPCSEPVCANILDFVIVPALMVDKKGFRLGYGGGFYDRFLAGVKNVKTMCAVPNELLTEVLPNQDFDIPVDFVICG